MSLDPWVLAAIASMSAVTFGLRAGGYWLFRAIRPPLAVRTALAYVPGALFVSYVVPALADGGPQQWVGAAATVALMGWTRRLEIAILGGTATAWAVWSLG